MNDSTTPDDAASGSTLRDDVQIYYNGADELRIRKGVWNFEEAILGLDGLGAAHHACVLDIFGALQVGGVVDAERVVDRHPLSASEREEVAQMLEALRAKDYLRPAGDVDARHFMSQLLEGTTELISRGAASDKPVLFFADTESIKSYAIALAAEIGMSMVVMTRDEFAEIESMDLTTRTEAYETRKQLSRLLEQLEPYCCVLGCLERPHIVFLRNINRGLIQASLPLSLGLLDGPFTTVFTIKPPETGCFECFEQRLLARMEDMSVYRQFVAQVHNAPRLSTKVRANPLMHSLAAQVLFEGLIVSRIGKAKLAGRVLNTYVPLMEIQVQPLLRISFCPACGFAAEARMEEMYSSSQKIIDRVVSRIHLVDDRPDQERS